MSVVLAVSSNRFLSGEGPLPVLGLAVSVFSAGWISIGSTLGALAGLWFKGAIAAFYLRRHWVGDDGAVFIDAPTSAPIVGATPTRPDL